MSDPEPFVARWSRLKRDRQEAGRDRAGAPTRRPAAAAAAAADQGAAAKRTRLRASFRSGEPPAIESITAGSDIRAFLQSGVPAELTKAALRRVWTTDPAIRDFIGIAENQWDFTDPTAMPGFGPLEATDDVRELVAQAMGKLGLPPPSTQRPRAARPARDASSAVSIAADRKHRCKCLACQKKTRSRRTATKSEGTQKEALAAPQHGAAHRSRDRPQSSNARPGIAAVDRTIVLRCYIRCSIAPTLIFRGHSSELLTVALHWHYGFESF